MMFRVLALAVIVVVTTTVVTTPVDAVQKRSGAVRIEGRALADDGGPWNALGASLFWALWGERHDASRLDANLTLLERHGVDYVRILGMVGAESWKDRAIEPSSPDYWATVDRLFARLRRHNLRAHVTLFADAQVMLPDNAARQRFVSAWAARANQHRDLIVALEVANESWQNGFEGPSGVTQLRALGAQLAAATPVPVALSSLPSPDDWCRVYAGVAGIDFASVHYDRDISGPERQWRPVAQPWGYPANYERGCEGRLPRAAISNEPIGPQSSVADDADPLRLALSVAMTFVSGNAAYVYHSGAGIRGGGAADLARGRAADFSKADSAVLDAIAAVRRRLPDGLANWTRHDAASSAMPWDGFQRAAVRGDLVGAYAATSDKRVVAVILGVRRPHTVTARRPMDITLVNPITGATLVASTLAAGASWTVPADLPGYLVVGSFK